jgi:surfeit locus 1 family protein
VKRWPILPTIVVAAAVAAMVALGIWQLGRKREKEALLALYDRNIAMSSTMAFPSMGPVPDAAMFRKSSAVCIEVVEWKSSAGKDAAGKSGIRYIAECTASGLEGPGLVVLAGVGDRPDLKPGWKGGPVSGMISTEPDRRSLLEKALGQKLVLRPMLVADQPVGGLRAAAQPSPKDVANNHLAYAVQWFFFAGAAAVIYLLALRRKQSAAN